MVARRTDAAPQGRRPLTPDDVITTGVELLDEWGWSGSQPALAERQGVRFRSATIGKVAARA